MTGRGEAKVLPAEIPIFPLTGALLLPSGRLPLNIFEPRYVAMVEDALKGPRLIGMVQPEDENAEARMQDPSVYRVGCAGRITLFRETRDRRFEIVLDGVSRFEIANQSETASGYRVAEVAWERFAADLDADIDTAVLEAAERDKLVSALERFLAARSANLKGTGIAELPDRELIAAIAMSCPFHPSEKQALLEADSASDSAALLFSLLEMAAFEHDGRISRQ